MEEVLKTIEIVDGIEIKNIELITDESKFNITKINGKPDPGGRINDESNVLHPDLIKFDLLLNTADDGTMSKNMICL